MVRLPPARHQAPDWFVFDPLSARDRALIAAIMATRKLVNAMHKAWRMTLASGLEHSFYIYRGRQGLYTGAIWTGSVDDKGQHSTNVRTVRNDYSIPTPLLPTTILTQLIARLTASLTPGTWKFTSLLTHSASFKPISGFLLAGQGIVRVKPTHILTIAMAIAGSGSVKADQRLGDLRRLNLDPRVAAKLPARCVYKVRSYRFFVSDPPCMKLFPLRRLRGIWYLANETSLLYPGRTKTILPERMPLNSEIWVDTGDALDAKALRVIGRDMYGQFAVDFVAYVPPLEGAYGHMGISRRGVLLQRVISIRRLD